MSLLKKIRGWLINRWVLSVLGLLILALLIWLFGSEVAIAGRVPLASEVNRLIAILVVVLVWAAIVIASASATSDEPGRGERADAAGRATGRGSVRGNVERGGTKAGRALS